MDATLTHIDTHNSSTKTFWFTPERMPYYIAGQFIELTLSGIPSHERNRRWYTLSSSPTEDMLAITTRFNSSDVSAYKQALLDLKIGDRVTISEPMGDFVLPLSKNTPILYVAAGIGITPLRSMLKWLIDTSQHRDIKLIYAAQSSEDIIYEDLFDRYGLSPLYLISKDPSNKKHEHGRIDADRILREYEGGFIYIAGPEQMTEELVHDLRDKKISATKLVTDYFPGYPRI